MTLSQHDTALQHAHADAERTGQLHRTAKADLEAKQLELHRAPHINEALAEQIAAAELDGEDAPAGQMIDADLLARQVPILKKRASVFLKGWQDASEHLIEVRKERSRAYGAAYMARAETILPRPAPSLRTERPSLHDYGSVTVEQLWQAYLLRNAGRVSRNPNDFGAFMGSLFAMPQPADDWPALRDEAIVWAEDGQEQGKAA